MEILQTSGDGKHHLGTLPHMQRVNRPRIFNYIVSWSCDPIIPTPSAINPYIKNGKEYSIIPLPLHRNSSNTPPMPVLPQPCILLCAENNNKRPCARFKAQRLDFEIVHPGVPEGAMFAIDVDVWGAVVVCEVKLGFFEG